MRVAVTGAAGFLGSHLCHYFHSTGHEVIGLDDLSGGDKDNLPEGMKFLEGRLQDDLEGLRNVFSQVDLVYHTACFPHEGLSVFSPATVVSSVIDPTMAVASAAIETKVKRLIHCSSMARYGDLTAPFTEDMVCRPQDPYGIAKKAAEDMLLNLSHVHGIEVLIAIPHNIYGPNQKYNDPFRNVAAIMANRVLRGKQPIIYGDGKQSRCFSYIDDVLSCLVEMAHMPSMYSGEIINIGPDRDETTIITLAELICEFAKMPFDPIFMPGRPQEVKHAVCSSDKARRLLGFEQKTELEEGIFNLMEWIKLKGPKEFSFHLPVEIHNFKTPRTWMNRYMETL